ncbi:MAG TPA: class I SAM-dependent methyltransferase [Candidatus Limnocylindrales bacterium]|nr:class I SAM-dependent methyltransferase [Candidatus Limnocylindrales bacterium]
MPGASKDLSKTDAATSFNIEEDPFFAQDLEQMARAVNYRRWQFKVIAPYVRGKVLEVGGGIGNFTPDLAACAESVVSLEPNAFCHRQLVEKTKSLSNVKVYNVTAEELDHKVPTDYLADTVVCMNVLEHIQDDVAAVTLFTKRLKAGGNLVLLIPAAPWAFGEIDKRLGHYRRYSKKSASILIRNAGLTISKLRYFNFIGVWGWWWNARFARSTSQSDLQIRIFDGYIVPWLSRLEALVPPWIGQSLLVAARKN